MSNFASNDNMTALFTAAGEKIGERAKIFPGTKAEWDALPVSEKIKYDYVAFAGDSQSGIVDDVPTENSENLVKSGGVYDSLATKANLTQISNPNLLDNPWFTVNQRGQNNYIENGYTVDRWKCEDLSDSGNTLSVSDDGIVCTASGTPSKTSFLRQFFDGSVFDDSVFTISMIIESSVAIRTYLQARTPNNTNIIDSGSVDVPANTPTIIKASANGQKINGNCYIRAFFNYSKVADAVVKIKAIKLEKGTVSTLAMDTAPNYTTELLKCQRYFNIIKSSNNTYKPIGFGYMDETTSARMAIPLSVPMRANPTIVISDLSKFRVCGEVFRNVSAMSVIDIENNIVHLSVTVSSSGTKYSPAILVDIAKDEYISFSADL